MNNNTTNGHIRAVSYSRVSTFDQVGSQHDIKASLEGQKERAEKYCQSQGWQYLGDYQEPGRSGEEFEGRKELQRLLSDAQAGQFDVVIIRQGDRLARDQFVYFQAVKLLEEQARIQLLNLAHPGPIVPPSQFQPRRNKARIVQHGISSMMAAFDQASRVDLLMEGKKRQVRAGRQISPHALYGYAIEYSINPVTLKKERSYVPLPAEYRALELLPDLVLKERLSDREIAARLDKLGIKPREGKSWGKTSVARILQHPFYAGKSIAGRQIRVIGPDGKARLRKNYDASAIVTGDHPYPHPWDWATFESMQERRRQNDAVPPRQVVSISPVAGLLVCGHCEGSMRYKPGDGRSDRPKRRPDYFVCGTHNNNPARCHINRVPYRAVMTRLAGVIDKWAKEAQEDSQRFYQGVEAQDVGARVASIQKDLEAVEREIAELPAKEKRFYADYYATKIGAEQLSFLIGMHNEAKAELLKRQAELSGQLVQARQKSEAVEEMRRFLAEWPLTRQLVTNVSAAEWPEGRPRQFKAVLSRRFAKIKVKASFIPHMPHSAYGEWQIEMAYIEA